MITKESIHGAIRNVKLISKWNIYFGFMIFVSLMKLSILIKPQIVISFAAVYTSFRFIFGYSLSDLNKGDVSQWWINTIYTYNMAAKDVQRLVYFVLNLL